MKCLVLAAGYATRLYPLTENFPKPLLDVHGKTILDWLIDDIDTLELVDEYIVISNHKFYNSFVAWGKTKKQKIIVLDDGTISNDTRLGAVKDIQFAIDELMIDDDALVIAGDNLLDFSLTKFVNYAKAKNTTSVMRYYEPDPKKLSKSGVLVIDQNDLVIEMQEKPNNPRSNWCCPPFYFYVSDDLKKISQGIADGCGTDAPGSMIAWLSQNTAVHAMEMPGKRYDIGTPENYEYISQTYKGIN